MKTLSNKCNYCENVFRMTRNLRQHIDINHNCIVCKKCVQDDKKPKTTHGNSQISYTSVNYVKTS